MIFWCRRCTLQSRPYSATAAPWPSEIICTSRWRLSVDSFWMKMGDPGTSACTCSKPVIISSSVATLRMPLPPPPSDALIMQG